jgi:hypothetical protein
VRRQLGDRARKHRRVGRDPQPRVGRQLDTAGRSLGVDRKLRRRTHELVDAHLGDTRFEHQVPHGSGRLGEQRLELSELGSKLGAERIGVETLGLHEQRRVVERISEVMEQHTHQGYERLVPCIEVVVVHWSAL